jgi:hypothetical protein
MEIDGTRPPSADGPPRCEPARYQAEFGERRSKAKTGLISFAARDGAEPYGVLNDLF